MIVDYLPANNTASPKHAKHAINATAAATVVPTVLLSA